MTAMNCSLQKIARKLTERPVAAPYRLSVQSNFAKTEMP
jgi:hypothetical protein